MCNNRECVKNCVNQPRLREKRCDLCANALSTASDSLCVTNQHHVTIAHGVVWAQVFTLAIANMAFSYATEKCCEALEKLALQNKEKNEWSFFRQVVSDVDVEEVQKGLRAIDFHIKIVHHKSVSWRDSIADFIVIDRAPWCNLGK